MLCIQLAQVKQVQSSISKTPAQCTHSGVQEQHKTLQA